MQHNFENRWFSVFADAVNFLLASRQRGTDVSHDFERIFHRVIKAYCHIARPNVAMKSKAKGLLGASPSCDEIAGPKYIKCTIGEIERDAIPVTISS